METFRHVWKKRRNNCYSTKWGQSNFEIVFLTYKFPKHLKHVTIFFICNLSQYVTDIWSEIWMRIHKDLWPHCAAIVAFFIHYLCLLQLDAFCTFQFFSAFRNGAGGLDGREYIILSLGSFFKVIKKVVGINMIGRV